MNPYLPAGEYIPDAEPYIFGDRVYIYGSHDKFGAPIFCVGDYVCWSAPVSDLTDWRYEGVIYKKNQDPKNKLGLRLLFAPDLCQGADGRFYLYYAFDFMGIMGVAVSSCPTGPFEFYGHVHYADGTLWGRKTGDSLPFDPAVLVDDDNRVFLYSGFYTPVPAVITGGRKLRTDGGVVLELESDMLTIRTPEKLIFPKQGEGSFNNHEFFEASSIRKYNDFYYFVYSSRHNHELCYAVSTSPTHGFRFMGTLVSIGDLFLHSNDENHANNYLGNTHGGLLRLEDDFYIFYHRQTNRSSYARQACVEKLSYERDEYGAYRFNQAEITSSGVCESLSLSQPIEARLACNLWAHGHKTGRYDAKNPRKLFASHPYFTQDEKGVAQGRGATQYVAHMGDGATAGFKYVRTEQLRAVRSISVRARANKQSPQQICGRIIVSADESGRQVLADIPVRNCSSQWSDFSASCILRTEKLAEAYSALYIRFEGEGAVDLLSVRFA
ncbi:family 43 glycosylhydrolase [Alloscardovia omnicolens]|uniref:family 43 glycosylhydrolase n=1 Tax=Alloscardovia omnicolens TaxID=419015 RepID=UPI0037572508